MTPRQAIELYLVVLQESGCSPVTIRLNRTLFHRFEQYCRQQKRGDVRHLTGQNLLDYATWLKTQKGASGHPLDVNYRNDHIRLVKRLFRLLYKRQLILTDITRILPVLHGRETLPRDVPDTDEVLRLLRTAEISTPLGFRDRTILELMYSTGIRATELCQLNLYDSDITGKTLRIEKGKGGRDRVVPIGRVACRYLDGYLKKVRPILLGKQLTETALFVTVQGRRLNYRSLSKIIRHFQNSAQLPKRVTCHALRHACAVGMLRGGANIRYIQELLGHSQISTTQIYTRLVPGDLKKIHNKTAPSERGPLPDINFDNEAIRWIPFKRRKRTRKKR